MARTRDQRRWRANTDRRRIEVYLPEDIAERLDALVAARNQRRAAVIADLVDAAAPAKPEPTPEPEPESAAEAEAEPTGYRLRKPKSGATDERRYAWVADVSNGERIGLSKDSHRYHRWRGIYIGRSIFARALDGDTRDEVIQTLIDQAYIYR